MNDHGAERKQTIGILSIIITTFCGQKVYSGRPAGNETANRKLPRFS